MAAKSTLLATDTTVDAVSQVASEAKADASVADSKGVSAGTQASTADSRAVATSEVAVVSEPTTSQYIVDDVRMDSSEQFLVTYNDSAVGS